MAKARKHFDLMREKNISEIKHTLPAPDNGSKSNFQRATKRYEVKDGHLFDKKRLVIKVKERQMEIIRDVHRGIGDSEHSKAMVSHRGKNNAYDKIAQRLFWHNIGADINEHVRSCEQCQKQGDLKSPKVDLKSIQVPFNVMKQIGADICNLPEVDGYRHVILLIIFQKGRKRNRSRTNQLPLSLNFCTR